METKYLPLIPVAITAPASASTTELGTQAVKTLPNSRHLAVKLHGGVKLAKRSRLLHDSNVQCFVTNLIATTEVSPHHLSSGEARDGH